MNRRRLIFIALIVAGLALIAYPFAADWYNQRVHNELAAAYDAQVATLPANLRADELERAHAYNASISGSVLEDPFVAGSGIAYPNNYGSVLNLDNNGLMGYLEIPLLGQKLPIYHGAEEAVLQKGVGHISTTALPVGGEGTHCVLVAHRGLPGNELFTNVDKLVLGDVFYLRVLGETAAYRIDSIQVVEPSALVELSPVPGEDYCTLVTCTPLNINSHRLLIRGVRTEYIPDAPAAAGAHGLSAYEKQLLIALGAGTLAIITAVTLTALIRRRRTRQAAGRSVR